MLVHHPEIMIFSEIANDLIEFPFALVMISGVRHGFVCFGFLQDACISVSVMKTLGMYRLGLRAHSQRTPEHNGGSGVC